jgi:hypothetical protein
VVWLGDGVLRSVNDRTRPSTGRPQPHYRIALRGMGYILGTPLVLCFLGEAHCKLGRPLDGVDCLAQAAQIIEMTDERYDEAELHRLRGDLLNATSNRAAASRTIIGR